MIIVAMFSSMAGIVLGMFLKDLYFHNEFKYKIETGIRMYHWGNLYHIHDGNKFYKELKLTKAEDVIYADKLWNWFGLSYASNIVLPRVFAHAMSKKWQDAMTVLLEEWDETWDWSKVSHIIDGTRIVYTKDNKLTKTPEWLINYRHPDIDFINSIRSKQGG